MALKRIRVVWGTPPFPGGRWRGGLFNFQRLPDPNRPAVALDAVPSYWRAYLHHALNLSMRGLLACGACAAVLAYFAGAALVLRRWERANPENRVGYADLVLPSRWATVPRLRAEGLLARGRALLAEGRFAEGFGLLRAGLDRKPDDHLARLDLARLYFGLRLRAQAESLLREGLVHGYPGREYMEFAFALAADADRPAERVALARSARASFAASSPDRLFSEAAWLDRHLCRALLADGRPEEALAHAEQALPRQDAYLRELRILHRLENRRPAEAAELAEEWASQDARAPEPLRLLARARREAGDFAAMDAALLRLRALAPARPDALLYALGQQHLAGRPELAAGMIEELLFRHGAHEPFYLSLASVLVELRHGEGLDRVASELRDRGLSPRPVLWARLQLALADGDWPSVLVHGESIRASSGPPPKEASLAWLETAMNLARACLDGASGTQGTLVECVSDRPGTLRLYKIVVESLLDAGRPATARHVLALAEGPYPQARTTLALRARVEAALAAAAPAPLAPREERPAELATAESLVAAFSERAARGDAEGAYALLAAARRARAPWFASIEPRLDALELPLRARGEDPLRLQLLVRIALARDARAPDELLHLARALPAESASLRANALLIVKEILRHSPDHREAIAQLAEWEPRARLATLDGLP